MMTPTLECPTSARTEGTRRAPFTPPSRSAARGLCRTCSKEPTCTFPRDPERAVKACDEFDSPDLAPAPTTGLPVAALFRPDAAVAAAHRGLCVNCDRRADCILPKGEAGVWRCEEYV